MSRILSYVIPVLTSLVLGILIGCAYTLYTKSNDIPIPDSVEIYRPQIRNLETVADTVKIMNKGTTQNRPSYTIRLRFNDRVIEVYGEAMNHAPIVE